jgi:hypothetical protein
VSVCVCAGVCVCVRCVRRVWSVACLQVAATAAAVRRLSRAAPTNAVSCSVKEHAKRLAASFEAAIVLTHSRGHVVPPLQHTHLAGGASAPAS